MTDWDLVVKGATMQVSSKLRRGEGRHFHWCPACKEMHQLPDKWTFNGDLEQPTYSPSFKHSSTRYPSYDASGLGIGTPSIFVCHYILTAGQLNFCSDCSHAMAGKTVPLPELPEHLRDPMSA